MEYFISTLSAEHALIIDDTHLLPNETVNKALIPAFGNIPILATRQEGYPVNESALPEKTHRLGQEKIFFTIAEVAKITEDALNQKNPGLIRCIYDLTQGWPAPTRTLINAIKQARDETEYSENLNLALRALRQFFESEAGSLTDNEEPESPAKRAIVNTYHASEDNSSPIYDQYRSYVHLSGLSFDESCQISNDASRANSMPSISARETQILRFLANGDKPNKIAQSLNVSIQTVRAHIRNVYKKLGVHDKGEALDIAIKKRLI